MRIGELARRAGCGVDTVRYYEREGLLAPPGRGGGNYRQFGEADVERLTFIRNCRALEMSLAEIRLLLGLRDGQGRDCGEVAAVLEAHIGHVAERMARLEGLLTELTALRSQCRGQTPVSHCGILRGLAIRRETEPARATDGCGRLDDSQSLHQGPAAEKK
jgi:Cd(II)/Pb(II)-responsive transcriptional regulator